MELDNGFKKAKYNLNVYLVPPDEEDNSVVIIDPSNNNNTIRENSTATNQTD